MKRYVRVSYVLELKLEHMYISSIISFMRQVLLVQIQKYKECSQDMFLIECVLFIYDIFSLNN